MKSFALMILCFQGISATLKADDSRFRFRCSEGSTTTRPYQIANEKDITTTVLFSKDSDRPSMAILNAMIQQQGVWGSLAPQKDSRGVIWDQGIILIGSFASDPIHPPQVENGATEGPYREFKVTGINVELPFARWVATDKDDPIDTPYVVEFHLELRSLIPKGLVVDGKPLDLKKYESSSNNPQGGVGNPTKP